MENIVNWFDRYRIDHKIDYINGVVTPMDKLVAEKRGKFWFVNGQRVSRKFVSALSAYYC